MEPCEELACGLASMVWNMHAEPTEPAERWEERAESGCSHEYGWWE